MSVPESSSFANPPPQQTKNTVGDDGNLEHRGIWAIFASVLVTCGVGALIGIAIASDEAPALHPIDWWPNPLVIAGLVMGGGGLLVFGSLLSGWPFRSLHSGERWHPWRRLARLRSYRLRVSLRRSLGDRSDSLSSATSVTNHAAGDPSVTRAVSYEEMTARFRALVATGAFDEVRIFGYTQEMLPEYLQWALRGKLRVEVLSRSWQDEEVEQKAHNAKLTREHRAQRKWDKVEKLKALATKGSDSNYQARFYTGRPTIKAILLSGPDRLTGFISFYHWLPYAGGSPYKGGAPDMVSMLHVEGRTEDERNVLLYLTSQFDVAWRNSKNSAELGGTVRRGKSSLQGGG